MKERTLERLDQWEKRTNAGWKLHGWLETEDAFAEKLGAMLHVDKQDVGFAPTLTVGMHLLLSTFYKPQTGRKYIVMLKSEFNSDVIAAESWVELYGLDPSCLILVETSDKNPSVAIDNILKVVEERKSEISLISMSLVSSHFCHYYNVERLVGPC